MPAGVETAQRDQGKRGEAVLSSNVVFAASPLWPGSVIPDRQMAQHAQGAGIKDPGYSSRERTHGRVNNPAQHCSNSYQSNVALKKSDEKKSSQRDRDSRPVNE